MHNKQNYLFCFEEELLVSPLNSKTRLLWSVLGKLSVAKRSAATSSGPQSDTKFGARRIYSGRVSFPQKNGVTKKKEKNVSPAAQINSRGPRTKQFIYLLAPLPGTAK